MGRTLQAPQAIEQGCRLFTRRPCRPCHQLDASSCEIAGEDGWIGAECACSRLGRCPTRFRKASGQRLPRGLGHRLVPCLQNFVCILLSFKTFFPPVPVQKKAAALRYRKSSQLLSGRIWRTSSHTAAVGQGISHRPQDRTIAQTQTVGQQP